MNPLLKRYSRMCSTKTREEEAEDMRTMKQGCQHQKGNPQNKGEESSQDDSCALGTASRLDKVRRLWGEILQQNDSDAMSDASELIRH